MQNFILGTKVMNPFELEKDFKYFYHLSGNRVLQFVNFFIRLCEI